jgi:lysozyme
VVTAAALPLPSGPAGGPRARGIDVSVYQGTIDWAKVAGSGISFAIARVTNGTTILDKTFAQNWAGMQANGVVRGCYQFFRPSEDPIAQADYMIATVNANGGFATGDLPPTLDVETLDGQSASVVAAKAEAWIDHVIAVTGIHPMVYCSPAFWTQIGSPAVGDKVDLWIANWGVTSPKIPSAWKAFTFWQHSSTGRVPGISYVVDLDVFNGTVDDLRAYATAATPGGFYRGIAPDSTGNGYWLGTLDGGVLAFGDATFRGTASGQSYAQPFVGIVRTPTGLGYWLFGADGNVVELGDAVQAGNLAGQQLSSPIGAMAATPTGQGYWLLGRDGTVSAFGDATFLGQPGAQLTGTAVSIAATPTGKGYWILSHDGTVAAFGDAPALAAVPASPSPAVAIAGTPSGQGYWIAAADGSVRNAGDAPALVTSGSRTSAPFVGLAPTASGQGYWLVATDGTVQAVGDAVDAGPRPR